MNKEFIPYKQALELKELGFDELCLFYYGDNEALRIYHQSEIYDDLVGAPLYQQAFRWFRNKGYLFEVSANNKARVWWDTYKTYDEEGLEDGEERVSFYSEYFNTYEEAEIVCLNKLIEIVKNK